MELVYKNEKQLFVLMLVLSAIVWALVVIGTAGIVLAWALSLFVLYCFAQSALISYIKGNGVRITEEQFPELRRQIVDCCNKLGLEREPEAYLLQMGGALNAFATRFLGRDFLVLYADVVDGVADNPDALNFYIGHEIGHIKRKHLTWATVLMPAMFLPLVGAAYSRAREYTCDRHGLAACDNPVNAERGLAVLAAGGKLSRTMNTQAYIDQSNQTEGFWMSFHELTGDYPWLVKRMAAVRSLAAGQEVYHPSRNKLAAVLALFVPRVGPGGGAAGLLVIVAVVGILAAVAVPQYQTYLGKASAAAAYQVGKDATHQVGLFYMGHDALPPSLGAAGFEFTPNKAVKSVRLDGDGRIEVVMNTRGAQGQGVLAFVPSLDDQKRVVWRCQASKLEPEQVPGDCDLAE